VRVLEATNGLDVETPEYSWIAIVPSSVPPNETWKLEPPVTFFA